MLQMHFAMTPTDPVQTHRIKELSLLLKGKVNHASIRVVITYYVGADGTEGVCPTHIEVSAIQPQEDFDVIKAVSLERNTYSKMSFFFQISFKQS